MLNPSQSTALSEKIRSARIIPVISVDTAEDGLRTAGAIRAAGLRTVEITFRTDAAAQAIAAVAREFPDMAVGAGTILKEEDVGKAADAGAVFAVAPGCNPVVVRRAAGLGLPFFPGIATPTEIDQAYQLGCRTLKFFPAEPCGGVRMLKAMLAPIGHLGLGFVPTGGIAAANMMDYLAIREVIAVGGTWIATRELIREKAWPRIEATAREALAILHSNA